MIKTIVVVPNFVENRSVESLITAQTEQWYNAGKHDNNVNRNIDQQNTLTIERWNWVDEESANEYNNFVLANILEIFPATQVNVVVQ